MIDHEYTTCGECLKDVVDIHLGKSDKDWSDLGKVGPLCTSCLKVIREPLQTGNEADLIKVKDVS